MGKLVEKEISPSEDYETFIERKFSLKSTDHLTQHGTNIDVRANGLIDVLKQKLLFQRLSPKLGVSLVCGDDARVPTVTAAVDATLSVEAKIITHGGTVIHAQLLNKNKVIGKVKVISKANTINVLSSLSSF